MQALIQITQFYLPSHYKFLQPQGKQNEQYWKEIAIAFLKKKYNTDCCGNHLSQRQMITQAVNLLSRISSGKFTRELDKESLLN